MTIPRWRLALTVGALVVLGVAGGSLVQAAAAPSAASTGAAAANSGAAAATDADAALLDALALTTDPTSGDSAAPAQLLALRDRIRDRLANIRGRLVHATLTVLDRDGKLATYQLDHGTVSAIGGTSITIAEAGGTSVTVATSTETRVRVDAHPATLASLKTGDEVLVRSEVNGGSASATLVLVLPAATTTAPSTGGNG
jgi:hypothetical protein